MKALVRGIAGPATVWALHFIALYALISAACAPRGLLTLDVMRAAAGLLTLAAAGVASAWLVAAIRALGRTGEAAPERPLAVAAAWSAAISLIAILANLWPVASLAGCTG